MKQSMKGKWKVIKRMQMKENGFKNERKNNDRKK